MSRIWHITKRKQWEQAQIAQVYLSDSLASEGFIHCSTQEQVLPTANFLFRSQQDLVLLGIDSSKVQPEIRYEDVDGTTFPHIYGALNTDAVVEVLNLQPGVDGLFELKLSDFTP